MNPTTSPVADSRPNRLVRRLVLGAALAMALAISMAPRTSTVHAQEPKAKSTATEKRSTVQKSITITEGRDGEAKIEAKTPDARAKSDVADESAGTSGDATDADTTKKGSKGHAVIIGKRGQVIVDGFGNDREFDNFGEFVKDEPELAGMVIAVVTVVFLSPVLAIGLILWYRIRKTRMLNETMLALAEKGVVSPGEALDALAGGKQAAVLRAAAATAPLYEQAKQIRRRAAWSDLRKGIILGGIGLALTLYSIFDDRSPNGLGLVLLFVGIGYVVLWWFEERHLVAPGSTEGNAANRSPPSGQPPY